MYIPCVNPTWQQHLTNFYTLKYFIQKCYIYVHKCCFHLSFYSHLSNYVGLLKCQVVFFYFLFCPDFIKNMVIIQSLMIQKPLPKTIKAQFLSFFCSLFRVKSLSTILAFSMTIWSVHVGFFFYSYEKFCTFF